MPLPGEVSDLFTCEARLPRRPAPYIAPRVTGYAAPPGTGPADATCADCAHRLRWRLASKTVSKCGHPHGYRSHSAASDIKARSPACKFFSKVEP